MKRLVYYLTIYLTLSFLTDCFHWFEDNFINLQYEIGRDNLFHHVFPKATVLLPNTTNIFYHLYFTIPILVYLVMKFMFNKSVYFITYLALFSSFFLFEIENHRQIHFPKNDKMLLFRIIQTDNLKKEHEIHHLKGNLMYSTNPNPIIRKINNTIFNYLSRKVKSDSTNTLAYYRNKYETDISYSIMEKLKKKRYISIQDYNYLYKLIFHKLGNFKCETG